MKKLLVFTLSFGLFVANANAQVQRDVNPSQKIQRDSIHKRHGQSMKDLNLSNEQKGQMKELRQSAKQRRDAIANDASLTQAQKKAKMHEMNKTQKEKMSHILTPDQKKEMQANKKDWKQNHKRKGGKMQKKNSSVEKTAS